MAGRIYLFDTNAIIEAVRTGVWNALTGALDLHTVETCVSECQRGDRFPSGYVVVDRSDLDRIAVVHNVNDAQVAAVLLMERAEALDRGELELFAHALGFPGHEMLSKVCSPDLASVRFAVAAGIGDCLISLQEVINEVGAQPKIHLRRNFTSAWLVEARTKARLGVR